MFAYVRRCSPIFAFNRRKTVEALDGERGTILQNARQTEMGTRGTRPSEHQRQRLARTNLDFGRARWLQGYAQRINGKAKGLSDRNRFFTCFTDERGSGLAENLRLSPLIFAYSRLSSLNGRKNVEGPRSISRAAPSGSATGWQADCKTGGLTLPRISKRGLIATKSSEARRVEGTARAASSSPSSPREERVGEDRGEGKPIKTHLLSPPSPPSDGGEGEIEELDAALRARGWRKRRWNGRRGSARIAAR